MAAESFLSRCAIAIDVDNSAISLLSSRKVSRQFVDFSEFRLTFVRTSRLFESTANIGTKECSMSARGSRCRALPGDPPAKRPERFRCGMPASLSRLAYPTISGLLIPRGECSAGALYGEIFNVETEEEGEKQQRIPKLPPPTNERVSLTSIKRASILAAVDLLGAISRSPYGNACAYK